MVIFDRPSVAMTSMGSTPIIIRPAKTIKQTAQKPEIKPPERHAVIIHNDDTTPRDFVVEVLTSQFNIQSERAEQIMSEAQNNGTAVVQVYPQDIAQSKASKATDYARRHYNPEFDRPLELTFTTRPV